MILPTARSDNALVLYRNWLIGRHGATVDSDSEAAGGNTPASNLLTEYKADPWRSGSVATRSGAGTPHFLVTFALPVARPFNFASPFWTNQVELPWKADFYAGDPDATGVLQATTDWTDPIVQSVAGDFPVAPAPTNLKPTAERLAALAADFRLKTFQTLAATVTGIDHVRFSFDCSGGTNGVDDFLQVSLFYGGVAFRPTVNYSLGTSIVPVLRSRSRRTAGNAKVGLGRALSRRFDLALEYLTDEEADEIATSWFEEEGEFARVFAWREPADAKRHLFYSFHGAFTGCGEAFEGVGIDFKGGIAQGSPVPLAKAISGIRIEETE